MRHRTDLFKTDKFGTDRRSAAATCRERDAFTRAGPLLSSPRKNGEPEPQASLSLRPPSRMGCSTGGGRREQILDKQERRGYDFCYMEIRLFQESRRVGIDPSAALVAGLRGETKNSAKSLKTNNP